MVTLSLLKRDDVVADSRDKTGRAPLSHAAEKGSWVTLSLLERDDVVADSQDDTGQETKRKGVVDALALTQ